MSTTLSPTSATFIGVATGATLIVGVAALRLTFGPMVKPEPEVRIVERVVEVAPDSDPDVLLPVFDGLDVIRERVPVRLVRVSPNLTVITDLQAVPGHPDRMAVLQKGGIALLLDTDTGEFEPWFELDVNGASEMGLLGLAFAPDFATSGAFYLHHSPPSGDRSVISRFRCDPGTLTGFSHVSDVLEVQQRFRNHQGGQLRFGPDGFLYIGFGDGGSAFDPDGNGQDPTTWLGAILRVEPLAEGGFTVPPDNPFVGVDDHDDAIFAYGLRNPWRFDFAPDGRLVVADVGQNTMEEVDLVPPGANLGWNHTEGDACLQPPCDGFHPPMYTYGRQDGISVTGGVFPGRDAMPALDGRFVFGDFGSGRLWALELPNLELERADEPVALGRFEVHPSAFATDALGRVFVADFEGAVYRLELTDGAMPAPGTPVR